MLLTAVELSGLSAQPGFLTEHPAVRQIAAGPESGFTVWVDAPADHPSPWASQAPDRPPEVEMHGPGAPAPALVEHPRAEYVEVFFDALGDPDHAPRGWWHARLWLAAA